MNKPASVRRVKSSKSILDCPALRYNWGFHDARAEKARGCVRSMVGHFDPHYVAGYREGLREDGQPIPTDDARFDQTG